MTKMYKASTSAQRGEMTIGGMSKEGQDLLMGINGHHGKRHRLIERSSSGKYYTMPIALAEAMMIETVEAGELSAKATVDQTLRGVEYVAGDLQFAAQALNTIARGTK